MKKNKKLWTIIISIVAVLVIIYIIGVVSGKATVKPDTDTPPTDNQQNQTLQNNEQNDAQKPNDDNVKPTDDVTEENAWFTSGTYIVGQDIPAGEYVILATSSNCYIEVAKDSKGTLDSIVTNDNFKTHAYQSLLDGQYFKVNGGKFIASDKAPKIEATDGTFEQGMYKVGKDIPAGEYKITANDALCYIEVSEDCSGILSSIVTNENISLGESTYITVSEGQFLKVSGGQISSK